MPLGGKISSPKLVLSQRNNMAFLRLYTLPLVPTQCSLWSRVLDEIPYSLCKCLGAETQVDPGHVVLCCTVSFLQGHPALPLQKCN